MTRRIVILSILALAMTTGAGASSPQTQPALSCVEAMFQECVQETGDAYRVARGKFLAYAQEHKAEVLAFLREQAKSDDFRKRIMARVLDTRVSHGEMIQQRLADIKAQAERHAKESILGDTVEARQLVYGGAAQTSMRSTDPAYGILRDVAIEQMWKGPDGDSEFAPIHAELGKCAANMWGANAASDAQRVDYTLLCLWLKCGEIRNGEPVPKVFVHSAWRRACHPTVVEHLKRWRLVESSGPVQTVLDRLIPGIEARMAGNPYREQTTPADNPKIDDLRRELLWHERRIADTPRADASPGQEQLRDKTQYLHGYLEGRRAAMVKQLDRETDPQERYWLEQALQWMDEEFPKAEARHPLPPPKAPSSRRVRW